MSFASFRLKSNKKFHMKSDSSAASASRSRPSARITTYKHFCSFELKYKSPIGVSPSSGKLRLNL